MIEEAEQEEGGMAAPAPAVMEVDSVTLPTGEEVKIPPPSSSFGGEDGSIRTEEAVGPLPAQV